MIRLSLLFVIGAGVFLWADHAYIRQHVWAQPAAQVLASMVTPGFTAPVEAPNVSAPVSGAIGKVGAPLSGLRLVGVIAGNDKKPMRAIIAIGEKQASYLLNARLPIKGNVTLDEIRSDRVMLNNNGSHETLLLYDSAQSTVNEPQPPSDAPKEVPLFYGRTPGPDEPPPYTPDEQQEEAALVEVGHNFTGLMQMAIERGENTHQLLGYKLSPAKDNEKFKALGLQVGDMITAINGVPITKPDEIMKSYKDNESSISLEIERNGSVINVELAQVNNL